MVNLLTFEEERSSLMTLERIIPWSLDLLTPTRNSAKTAPLQRCFMITHLLLIALPK